MAPQTRRPPAPEGGMRPFAVRLLVAGLLMALLPWALGRTLGVVPGHGMLRALANLGWLLSVLAGLLYLVGGRPARPVGGERSSTPPSSGPLSSTLGSQPPVSRFGASSRMPSLDSQLDGPGAPPNVWSPAVFRVIEWRRFEAVLEAYFSQAGFVTGLQSHGPEGGVDIWLYSRHEPGVPVGLVHGKHWHGKKVTTAQIREFMKLMASHQLRRGMFATASMFTPDGADYARNHHVQPLDPQTLVELIAQRTPEEQKALLSVALQGEYWRPSCWKCQGKMVERDDAEDGKPYWGCANHVCNTRLGMRKPSLRRV